LVGEYANKGREWQPKGQPVQVNGHDFPHRSIQGDPVWHLRCGRR
jgi:hypothetical protein